MNLTKYIYFLSKFLNFSMLSIKNASTYIHNKYSLKYEENKKLSMKIKVLLIVVKTNVDNVTNKMFNQPYRIKITDFLEILGK